MPPLSVLLVLARYIIVVAAEIMSSYEITSKMEVNLDQVLLNFPNCEFHFLRTSASLPLGTSAELDSYTNVVSKQLSCYTFVDPFPEPCDWFDKGPRIAPTQRHSFCRVLVFGQEFLASVGGLWITFRCLPRVLFLSKPSFSLVITLQRIPNGGNDELHSLISTIRKASVPSIFVLYSPSETLGRPMVRLVIATSSAHGSSDSWPMLQMVPRTDTESITAQYHKAHKNLRGLQVRTVGVDHFLSLGCVESMQSDVFQLLVRICLVQEIKRQLNFTEVPNTGGIPWTSEDWLASTIVTNIFNQDHLYYSARDSALMNYRWVPSCSEYLRISYLQVFDKELLTREAIWGGMGLRMYLLYFSALLLVILALFITLRGQVGCSFQTFLDLFMAAGSAFMEQSEIPRRIRNALNFRAVVLLCLWAHISSHITNTYKGSLYSALSSPLVGAQPENLHQVVQFPGELISMAKFWNGNGWTSTIHNSLEAVVNKVGPGSSFSGLVSEFKGKLIFDNEHIDGAILGQLNSMQKSDEKLSPLASASQYILFEKTSILRAYKVFMDLTKVSENKVIQAGKEVPLLREIGPVLVQGNFVAANVAKVTNQIAESGIWSMWEKFYDRWYAIQHYKIMRQSFKIMNLTDVKSRLRMNIAAVLFDGETFHLFEKTFKRERPPSSLKALLRIFEFYLISISVACAALICEIFWGCFAKNAISKMCCWSLGLVTSEHFVDLYARSRKVSWLSTSSQVTVIKN